MLGDWQRPVPVAYALLRLERADQPSDFDNKGNVDGADFLAMQRASMTVVTRTAWERQYGASTGDSISASLVMDSTAREPSRAMLLLGLPLGLLVWYKPHHGKRA